MRKKVIAGNWKMNMLPNEAMEMIAALAPLVKDTENEVVLCVPYTDLFYSLLAVQETNIKIGAQNMHFEEKGAYTGEISGKMLKSIGVQYVIIGHSERRQYFAETDETVNKKIKAAFLNNLKPIVCVGETLEQREAGIQYDIITEQTKKALDGLTEDQVANTIIAYEPIWAIDSDTIPTNKEIEETTEFIKGIFPNNIVLYGGGVTSDNIYELSQIKTVDGFLLGRLGNNINELEEFLKNI